MFTALFVTRQYFTVMLPQTLDRQETRRVWLGTAVFALLGGAFMGLGYILKGPGLHSKSPLMGLGEFFLIVFGTAVVLVGSMWVFRAVYKITGHQRTGRLPMFKLLSAPKVDWMAKRHYFWVFSAILVGGGMLFAWKELRFDTSKIMDIEFIGGTSVQVEVKDPAMKDEQLAGLITGDGTSQTNAPGWLLHAADDLANAQVSKLDENRYLVKPAESLTTAQLEALLVSEHPGQTYLSDLLVRGGIRPADGGVEVQLNPDLSADKVKSVEDFKTLLAQTAAYARGAAERMKSVRVQLFKEETGLGETRNALRCHHRDQKRW